VPDDLADKADMKWLIRAAHMGASFWADQEGPTIAEYAVLLALIVLGVFALVTLIGEFAKDAYSTVTNGLPEVS
jgi:Flp pilus assembly pilin Flp